MLSGANHGDSFLKYIKEADLMFQDRYLACRTETDLICVHCGGNQEIKFTTAHPGRKSYASFESGTSDAWTIHWCASPKSLQEP